MQVSVRQRGWPLQVLSLLPAFKSVSADDRRRHISEGGEVSILSLSAGRRWKSLPFASFGPLGNRFGFSQWLLPWRPMRSLFWRIGSGRQSRQGAVQTGSVA